MFDDKLMLNEEYRYNGVKGGAAWKSKLERYFVSKAPVLRELLEWAESQDNTVIDEATMVRAVSARLGIPLRTSPWHRRRDAQAGRLEQWR